MNIKPPTPLLLLALFLIIPTSGGILSNVFGSNMVLQRSPVSASLYGWSTNGDTITVSFNNLKKYQTQAGGDGAWSVSLDPVEAGGPYSILVISGSNASETVNLTNILFGDVYLCGGQSNMQFTVNEVFNASSELANADNYPQIRLLTVGQGTTSSSPLNELATIEQVWSVASHQALGSSAGAFQYFSAVCWFSALNIFKSFNSSVPLGLVSSNWGGTIIQAWSSSDALAQCPQSPSGSILSSPNKMAVKSEMYSSEVKAGGPPTTDSSVLWNAMIVPFLQMKVSAFLWYQGEANVGETDLYRCLFPAMINDWRAKWGLGDLPFIFAQLSPYTTDGPLPFWYSLADMRLAQTSALALPNVGMASTVDAGDTGSPFTNIHPRDKQVVGYRMSLSLLSFLYGVPNVIHSGPTLSSATIAPNNEVIINFLPTTIGSGLELRGASCPTNFTTYCSTWELGLSDGTWHVASASILNTVAVTLTIPSSAYTAPANVTAARYLYNDWPVATLYSSSTGLPANPFYFVFIP